MDDYMAKEMLGLNATDERKEQYFNVHQVSAQTPPAFILCCADDKTVSCDNSILYFQALRKNGVEASLHIYPEGGHGWGFRDSFAYKEEWTKELERWLLNKFILKSKNESINEM
jgi:acetyl esterase/lipase